MNLSRVIGVDIGGTNIDIVLLDSEFKHLANFSTHEHFKNFNEILENFVSRFKAKAVGVGAAIWLKEGKIVKAPNLPSKLELELSVPTILENDANCFAFFAYKTLGFQNLLGITIGTGVGSGIIVDGKIYRGSGLAGEIGHWTVNGKEKCSCGGSGHLESYFSGWALERRYGKSVKELMKIDKDFIYSLNEFDLLCKAVANSAMLLDPLAIVFGGRIGMNLSLEKLKARIYRYLMHGFSPEIKILKDELAVAKGACFLALDLL
ncbi:MAG TPA: ROK family protein [Candidatus Altiarchaeales archaeon]|nr:ROK family protein [Candidatus Altiarchaeales archaeon]